MNLRFGVFHSKSEHIYEACLKTLSIFVAKKTKNQGMKRVILASACCVCCNYGPLCAAESEDAYPEGHLSEDKQIALLLQASQRTCEQLKTVQASLSAFRTQESVCIQSPRNTEALYKLSECALKLLNAIHETHVESYFRSAFLEELERISKTAKTRAIPPICTHD